jgi:hypothetical protein
VEARLIKFQIFGSEKRGNVNTKMSALIIKSPYIEKILAGTKVWEIRGTRTSERGKIALLKSGARLVMGTCEIVDVKGPLSLEDMRNSLDLHCDIEDTRRLPYKKTYAWVLDNPIEFDEPIYFKNPPGAVIWVNLPPRIASLIDSKSQNASNHNGIP